MNPKKSTRGDERLLGVVVAALVVVMAGVNLLSRPIWAAPQEGVSAETQVQLLHQEERHEFGQPVRPVYEGWAPIPDKPGMVNMYFGYMNVNWVEQPDIPIGPNNTFNPGVDQGQPTYFLTRRHMNNFYFPVPQDFKGTYTWSITVHGITQTAVGSLDPVKQIDTFVRTEDGNKPPVVQVETQNLKASLSNPATLLVNVTDDGLPKPRQSVGGGADSATPETKPLTPALAHLEDQRGFEGDTRGLTVEWHKYRGPGTVTFKPYEEPVTDNDGHPSRTSGVAKTEATFSAPGDYWIQSVADDGSMVQMYHCCWTTNIIRVTVTGQGGTQSITESAKPPSQ